MGIIRVYIKPLKQDGTLSADFQEVTKYVDSVGTISQDVDSLDYQLGVYRNSNFDISFINRSGKFSDVDQPQSIFKNKRSDSICKITFQKMADRPKVGFCQVGFFSISKEIELFQGLLNDESTSMDALSETVSLTALGFESLFSRVPVPTTIVAGDDAQTVLFKMLNQSVITDYLTVDIANINPNINLPTDEVLSIAGKIVKDALDPLLVKANSVLYIKNSTVYVTSRAASATVKKTFYGQQSLLGPENVVNLKNIKNGASKQFNYFAWDQSTIIRKDNNSIQRYKTKKKSVPDGLYTNTIKRNTILDALVAEFKDPKQEFSLETGMDYKTIALNILDKVQIDYPTAYVAGDFPLPICGLAICGQAVLPKGLWAFKEDLSSFYKILSRSYEPSTLTATFKLRKI